MSRWRAQISPYIFLSPFLLLFSLFFLYPLLRSLMLSFCSTIGPNNVRFVGLRNYLYLSHDIFFLGALANTAARIADNPSGENKFVGG